AHGIFRRNGERGLRLRPPQLPTGNRVSSVPLAYEWLPSFGARYRQSPPPARPSKTRRGAAIGQPSKARSECLRDRAQAHDLPRRGAQLTLRDFWTMEIQRSPKQRRPLASRDCRLTRAHSSQSLRRDESTPHPAVARNVVPARQSARTIRIPSTPRRRIFRRRHHQQRSRHNQFVPLCLLANWLTAMAGKYEL